MKKIWSRRWFPDLIQMSHPWPVKPSSVTSMFIQSRAGGTNLESEVYFEVRFNILSIVRDSRQKHASFEPSSPITWTSPTPCTRMVPKLFGTSPVVRFWNGGREYRGGGGGGEAREMGRRSRRRERRRWGRRRRGRRRYMLSSKEETSATDSHGQQHDWHAYTLYQQTSIFQRGRSGGEGEKGSKEGGRFEE